MGDIEQPFIIRDIMEYSNKKKIPTYLLNLDEEKAFDRVDGNYVFKCHKKNELLTTINRIHKNYEFIS